MFIILRRFLKNLLQKNTLFRLRHNKCNYVYGASLTIDIVSHFVALILTHSFYSSSDGRINHTALTHAYIYFFVNSIIKLEVLKIVETPRNKCHAYFSFISPSNRE